ncbi:Uncharacterized conserved protein YndB, AHSA1/START domain [Nocardioides alpinus]|uniref:Uncharacterized conserved protein YndB, AHSA1/START domain n=1 Tax=Nocardioides alpinus TaxID=748909 RepID=A0A1I1B914_9ACTN|nr:SRPBCC domain-containing protein [Nocardioides alpinus]PKH40466.1 hypothetical protein CXG46_12590 [Nocardioides alpinus]SFB46849.1 Uncharacterized conserved protein YndB, AHSA1/START domain [Nocardioides alpinus]
MKILATLHRLDETRGAVRVEDVYATDIEDLWEACTRPERLARWIASVSGDLEVGGAFTARFTSGWEGNGRVDVCERPHRLVLTTWEDEAADQESTIEATLSEVEGGTRLVIEERGVPLDQLATYGAGWQVHAEDLAAHVAGSARDEDEARWVDMVPTYREMLGA